MKFLISTKVLKNAIADAYHAKYYTVYLDADNKCLVFTNGKKGGLKPIIVDIVFTLDSDKPTSRKYDMGVLQMNEIYGFLLILEEQPIVVQVFETFNNGKLKLDIKFSQFTKTFKATP